MWSTQDAADWHLILYGGMRVGLKLNMHQSWPIMQTSLHRRAFAAGCRRTAQATLLELLEEAGLPPVCVAAASAEQRNEQLGAVLAAAVQVRCADINRYSYIARHERCRSGHVLGIVLCKHTSCWVACEGAGMQPQSG